VMRAIEFARSEDIPIAVRGGSHSLPGFSTTDGGIVIDCGPMNSVRIDPATQTAVVGPGATWAEFDHEAQAFGLAVTGGLVSTTGVAGFTLGGGIGWLMRKQGLACDNLIAADVVTADGRMVRASADENPDLLWGLKGGGGNFGIVTSFEFQLHQVGPMVMGGPIFYPGDNALEVLRFVRDFVKEIDDDLTVLVNLTTAPPVPFLPAEWHGKKVALIACCYAGSVEDGARAVQPLREIAEPIADLIGPMPYTALQSLLDPLYAKGSKNYFKSGYLNGLGDGVVDVLTRYHQYAPSPQSEIHVHHFGGAVAKVADGDTAFGHRGAPYVLNIIARSDSGEDYEPQVEWAKRLHAATEEFQSGGTYVNFLTDQDQVRSAYEPETYERLQQLKGQYDPDNVFALNQNIAPA
jgi:FAD/FMN-containing dehydrogenase